MRHLLMILCATAAFQAPAFASDAPPNVVFILTDDLGWGDLGVLHQNAREGKRHATPHLDAMADEGLVMRRHYCPAPVCAPSRSSLFTGVHQGNAHIRDNQFDKALEDNHTLASVLRRAGYATALVGKYGLQGSDRFGDDVPTQTPSGWPAYPTERGFDEFFGYVRHKDGHLHYPVNPWPLANKAHRENVEVWWNDREVSADLDGCYTSDLFTARAKHWIAGHVSRSPERPFFLMLTYDTPHAALQVPAGAYPSGFGTGGGVQWTGEPGRMINTAGGEVDSFIHPDYADEGWPDLEARFATMVRRLDDNVHDVLQTLRDVGVADNTLVVFTSDNGPHHESYVEGDNWGDGAYSPQAFQSYGPFDGVKRDTYEGGVRMPTLAWGPGIVPGGRVDETPSQFHDWLPTLASLAGVAPPARSDGVSLLPTLTGEGRQTPSTVYIEYQNNARTPKYDDFLPTRRGAARKQMQVIHLGGYKGVRTNIKAADDPFQIYDLDADPLEETDLADTSEEMRALQRRMQDRVLQLRHANDSAPRPYDGAPVPPLTKLPDSELPDGDADPAVRWTAYAGAFDYVPQTAGLREIGSGESDEALAARLDGAGVFEFVRPGVLPEETTVEFSMSSDRPFFVRLNDGGHLIDADAPFEAGRTYTATRRLGAGLHEISVIALTDDGGAADVELTITPVEAN